LIDVEALMTSKSENNIWRSEQAPRLRLKTWLIYLLFTVTILFAMGGWLYFLGNIFWRFVIWILK
jgi:hypothetical protein